MFESALRRRSAVEGRHARLRARPGRLARPGELAHNRLGQGKHEGGAVVSGPAVGLGVFLSASSTSSCAFRTTSE